MVKNEKTYRASSQQRVRMFINMARKYGLSELKVGEIEFKLATVSQIKPIDSADDSGETESDPMPSDEEMLFMSTPHYDHIQASKKSK